jgi:hypothetical protein
MDVLRGWRGQAPRQLGQIRKEAAATSPAWVDVNLSPKFQISYFFQKLIPLNKLKITSDSGRHSTVPLRSLTQSES